MITAVMAALLGLGVGSFLNVVADRVPSKLPVGPPWSGCSSCAAPRAGRDSLPVVSWLVSRGRCRTCGARVTSRGPLLELACAALFAATAVRFGLSYELPAYLVLAAGLLALSAIDLEHKLLPNLVVYPTGLAVGALLVLAALAKGEPELLVGALVGALGSFGLFFLLHFVSPSGMAFGDVRLSFVLGMAVGWLELELVPLFLFASFLVSALAGVVYAVTSGKGLKAAIPFGPFLALGAELAILVGRPLLDGYLGR